MIVTADLHLTEDTEDIVFGEVLPGLVQKAQGTGDFRIAILGDIYHVRYKVSVRLQNRLLDFLAQTKVCWILLPGNHDQINPRGEHALEVFRELETVMVFTEPEWGMDGLWIPYRKDLEAIRQALALPKPSAAPMVAWMHHGVRGALMNSTIRDTDGIPSETFNEFERVFCGHYHLPQDLGFLSYVGSPYQTRADEAGQQKRIGMWDRNTKTMHWSPVNWGRRFFRIEAGPHGVELPADVTTADEIRIQAQPGVDPEALAKTLAERGFDKVVVTPVQQAAQARLQVDPSKGLPAYVQGYVAQFADDLDPKKLMDLYQEIIG